MNPFFKKTTGLILSHYILFILFPIFTPIQAQNNISHLSRLTLPVTSTASVVITTSANSDQHTNVLIHDYLSSTKTIVNEDGSIVEQPSYYPYGTFYPDTPGVNAVHTSEVDITNRYYTGQRKVTNDSPIYNYNARYYNPDIGIFIQPDSVEGPNRYAYVGGNPIMKNDPSGNFCIPCIIGISALIGMMTTSPMASTPADTPGELAQVRQWEQTGGQEQNYMFGRMIPGVGQAMGVLELATGQDVLGRDTHGLRNILNVTDIAGMGLIASGAQNTLVTRAGEAVQARGGLRATATSLAKSPTVTRVGTNAAKNFTIGAATSGAFDVVARASLHEDVNLKEVSKIALYGGLSQSISFGLLSPNKVMGSKFGQGLASSRIGRATAWVPALAADSAIWTPQSTLSGESYLDVYKAQFGLQSGLQGSIISLDNFGERILQRNALGTKLLTALLGGVLIKNWISGDEQR